MKITLVAAMDKNMLIGSGGDIPWLGKLPLDMKHFRSLTLGKTILMGRKTFASIGKGLPGRKNIVLTRDRQFRGSDAHVIHDISAITSDNTNTELMVIGGAEIYKLFLPLANKLELTIIEHEFIGDTYFPTYEQKEWMTIAEEKHMADEKNIYDLCFLTLSRK